MLKRCMIVVRDLPRVYWKRERENKKRVSGASSGGQRVRYCQSRGDSQSSLRSCILQHQRRYTLSSVKRRNLNVLIIKYVLWLEHALPMGKTFGSVRLDHADTECWKRHCWTRNCTRVHGGDAEWFHIIREVKLSYVLLDFRYSYLRGPKFAPFMTGSLLKQAQLYRLTVKLKASIFLQINLLQNNLW